MIQKLENGNILITLGEGTVFIGNIYANDDDVPFGIYFSNQEGKSDDAVIIQMTSEKAIASYMMALVRFLEAHANSEMEQLNQTLQQLKKELEPLLPTKNEK